MKKAQTNSVLQRQHAALMADDKTPQEIAAMRWKAVEAFNTCEGLSPMARRVGIALITIMDSRERACFPSEQRLAAMLGVDIRSIKKAKKELWEAQLVTWHNPGGPRHLSHYVMFWEELHNLAMDAKARGDDAMEVARLEQSNRGHLAPTVKVQGAHMAPTDKVAVGAISHAKRNFSLVRGGRLVQSVGAVCSPELSPYLSPELAQHHHAVSGNGAAAREEALKEGALEEGGGEDHPLWPSSVPEPPEDVAKRKALAAKSYLAEVKFPALLKVFASEPDLKQFVTRLPFDHQEAAAKLLATKGAEKARAYVEGLR